MFGGKVRYSKRRSPSKRSTKRSPAKRNTKKNQKGGGGITFGNKYISELYLFPEKYSNFLSWNPSEEIQDAIDTLTFAGKYYDEKVKEVQNLNNSITDLILQREKEIPLPKKSIWNILLYNQEEEKEEREKKIYQPEYIEQYGEELPRLMKNAAKNTLHNFNSIKKFFPELFSDEDEKLYDELFYTLRAAWPYLNLQVIRDNVIPLIEEINLVIEEKSKDKFETIIKSLKNFLNKAVNKKEKERKRKEEERKRKEAEAAEAEAAAEAARRQREAAPAPAPAPAPIKETPKQQLTIIKNGYIAPFLDNTFKYYLPTYVMRNSYRVLKKKNIPTMGPYSFVTPGDYISNSIKRGRVIPNDTDAARRKERNKGEKMVTTNGNVEDALREFLSSGVSGRADKYSYKEHWTAKTWYWAVKQMKVPREDEEGNDMEDDVYKELLNNLEEDYNVEFLIMRKLNEEFVYKNITPHITLMLGMNRFQENNTWYVNIAMEYCDHGDFSSFLDNQFKSINTLDIKKEIENIKTLFMQLFFTFAVILDKYPDYRHCDLKPNNILVQSRKKDCDHYYFIDDKIYKVPKEFPYSIRLADFGLNHMVSGGIVTWTEQDKTMLPKYEYADIWSLMFFIHDNIILDENGNTLLKFAPNKGYGDIGTFVENCLNISDIGIMSSHSSEMDGWHLYDVKPLWNKFDYISGFKEPYNSEFLEKTWKSFLTNDPLFETLSVTKEELNAIPDGTKIHAYGTIEELNKYTKLNSLKVLNRFPGNEYKDFQNLQTAGCMVCS
jgi:serine/threonine protein kinase